jgi:hypothetical protein
LTTPVPIETPDGRYLVVQGRLWRRSNPAIPERTRAALVAELMSARRAVRVSLGAEDTTALKEARSRVQAAKVALGERGPVWWTDGAPDQNRRLIRNSSYAEWYQRIDHAG